MTMVGVGIFGFLLMLAFSHAQELRRGRWVKITISLPFLVASSYLVGVAVNDELEGMANLAQYMICWIILMGIWIPNIGWVIGQGAKEFLFASNRAGGGYRVDFRIARSLIDEDRLDDALKALKLDLEKDLYNYEGRWLMAAIYKETNRPDKGLEQIKMLKMNLLHKV